MPRTTFSGLSSPSFIAQQGLEDRDNGHQIDWDNVTAGVAPVPALNAQGKKVLLAGTPVGSLLGDGMVSPRAANTNPAVGLLATNAVEGETHAALSGYGLIVGGVIYENFIPGASGDPLTLDQDIKDELAAAGTGFSWRQYTDDRV
jgi:hypothetical protein